MGFADMLDNCNLHEISKHLVMGHLGVCRGSRIVVCWPVLAY